MSNIKLQFIAFMQLVSVFIILLSGTQRTTSVSATGADALTARHTPTIVAE